MSIPPSDKNNHQTRQHALHLLNTPVQSAKTTRIRWRYLALLVVALLLLTVNVLVATHGSRQPEDVAQTHTPYVASNPTTPEAKVGGAAVDQATVTAAGFVKAERISTVSAEITGTVENMYVKRGDMVKKGGRLASLDGRSLRTQVASLHASQQVVAGKLAQSRARLPRAKAQVTRFNSLLALHYVSQDEVDIAKADLQALQAEIAQYKAEYQQAGWQIKTSEIDLSRTEIRAPFDGRIVSLDASPGETVSPISAGGGFTRTGIVTIIGLDNFNAEVWLPENQLSKVYVQQTVTVKPDGLPDLHVRGTVNLISPVVDEQRAAVLVVVTLGQQLSWLKHNMSVQVDFDE